MAEPESPYESDADPEITVSYGDLTGRNVADKPTQAEDFDDFGMKFDDDVSKEVDPFSMDDMEDTPQFDDDLDEGTDGDKGEEKEIHLEEAHDETSEEEKSAEVPDVSQVSYSTPDPRDEEIRQLKFTAKRFEVEKQNAEIDSQVGVLQKKLLDANEKGDSAEVTEAQMEILKLMSTRQPVPSEEDIQTQSAQEPARLQPATQKAREYGTMNPWIFNPSSDGERAAKTTLTAIDQSLAAEGYDMNSDEYFQELGRRVNRRHPGVFKMKQVQPRKRQAQSSKRERGQTAKTPVPQKTISNKQRNRFTKRDAEAARLVGLDPTDASVQKELVRSRLAREAAERRA